MDEPSPKDGSFCSRAGGEQPIPDWAPFAVPSDEVWRELQRRRNIIRILRELTNMARDEGYSITASLLAETASRAQATLIQAHGAELQASAHQTSVHQASVPQTLVHQASALQASALQSLEELAAAPRPAARRRVQIKPFQLRAPASE
jgi:hypothetical protein